MTTFNDYNGWTNYETWNVNLWLSNDESVYNSLRREMPPEGWTDAYLEMYVKEVWPEGTSDFDSKKDYEKVNWLELAESLNVDEGIYPEVFYQARVDTSSKGEPCLNKFILSFTSEFSINVEVFIVDDYLIDHLITYLENTRNGTGKICDAKKQLLSRGSDQIKNFVESSGDIEFEDYQYDVLYVDSSGFVHPVELKKL